MSNTIIHRGTTLTLSQPISAGSTLTIDPTGTGIVSTTLANDGVILARGGGSGGGAGGTLSVTGTLTNEGTATFAGGGAGSYQPGGQGSQLAVAGVLVNTGTLSALGGAGGTYLEGGAAGGTIAVTGTFDNDGVVFVRGGAGATSSYAYSGGGGGVLLDSGSMDNAGTLSVNGGASGGSNYGGAGGTLSVGGALTNEGTLRVQGGTGNGGAGLLTADGYVHNTGLLSDAGLIDVSGGFLAANGTLLNDGTLVVDGGGGKGAYTAATAGVLEDTGYIATLWNRSVLTVGGGRGAASPGVGGGLGGTMVLSSGYFENDDQLRLLGGTAGSGGGGGGGGAQMVVTDTFFLGGTVTVGAPQGGAAATLTLGNGAFVQTTGVLENDGVMVVQAGAFMDNGLSASALLVNSGTIVGAGGEIKDLAVHNQGIVDVGVGRIEFSGDTITAPAGAGTFVVDPGGFLSLSGSSLDSHQTITLTGSGAAALLELSQARTAIVSPSGGVISLAGGGSGTLAASDAHLSVFLTDAGALTLSRMGFITATGSAGNDTLTALSSDQTLTGGAGTDHLTGAAATSDTFLDTASGLNGDVIGSFAGSDVIDVTNIASSGATLSYEQGSGQGTLTVANGVTSTSITLLGTFTMSSFTTATDHHGGVLITLH